MTSNFAKNLPRAHGRQAEVCALAATEFQPRNCRRLTRLRPQSSPFGLPVCVTGVPAAPLCETPPDSFPRSCFPER